MTALDGACVKLAVYVCEVPLSGPRSVSERAGVRDPWHACPCLSMSVWRVSVLREFSLEHSIIGAFRSMELGYLIGLRASLIQRHTQDTAHTRTTRVRERREAYNSKIRAQKFRKGYHVRRLGLKERPACLDSFIVCLWMSRPYPRLVDPLLVSGDTALVYGVPVQLFVELQCHGR
jgi:hypothetical protein